MVVKQIINSVFKSNTYLLYKKNIEDVWLVDCGDAEQIMSALQPNQRVSGVLLTHAHFDHIYGLNAILNRFPNCIVYTNEEGKEALFSAKKNFSFYHDTPFVLESDNVKCVNDGERIILFLDQEANAFYTPGHSYSCISYQIASYLFTGDSYIPGAKPVANLKGGNKILYQESLGKIFRRVEDGIVICPGHGEIV